MNIGNKYIQFLLLGVIISLLPITEAFATIEFHLLLNDTEQKIDCDYLEIQNNQALCSTNNLQFTYDIAQIRKLKVVNNGKSFHLQDFTQDTIKRINDLNSKKIASKNAAEQVTDKQRKAVFYKLGFMQQLSFESFSSFINSVKNSYTHYVGNSTLGAILLGFGLIVFLVGSIGYLIATFRAGILWGLSCMFLPFVSFVFLFVHWKIAAKPFFVSMLGITIIFFGTIFVPVSGIGQNITKHKPLTTTTKTKRVKGHFKCSGKIYCSEMTSCSEAKFYLHNCPGTKMDGNNDGIPCEKQWCGN